VTIAYYLDGARRGLKLHRQSSIRSPARESDGHKEVTGVFSPMSDPGPNSIVSANGLVVRYGTQTVLDRSTLTIRDGERVGLVGRNGSGKTTFLQIAAGILQPDAGELVRRRNLVTGYMAQRMALDESETVRWNILSGARHILDLVAEYEHLPGDSPLSATLLDQINHFDGWNIEHRIRSLISNLHTPAPERIVETLSGGEKRRVALCRALVARPDFLILDEPTNHLDTDSIEWLEDFLARYSGSCLFVTHDRYFLDRVPTRIVELSQGQFHSYDGNYTDFLLARAARQAGEELQERKRQKFLKRELDWVRRSPSARRTKSINRVKQYFEMAAKEAPTSEIDIELIIPPIPKLGNRVIELRAVGMELGGRILFKDLNLDLAPGERLGVIGRNGLGKSTLLKLMLGELRPTAGEIELGARTDINYVDQNRSAINDQNTVWEEVGEGSEVVRLGDERISLRAYLRRFLFSEERINSKIELLSGGERSRLILAKILKHGGNVLLLDEPTNDLDLGTLRLLEEALVGFGGTVVVVSHDRYFLNRVCTSILAFEGDGQVRYAVGNYDYYLEKRLNETGATESVQESPRPIETQVSSFPPERHRKLTWKETKELDSMEAVISAAEDAVGRLESEFADPDFYTRHGQDWRLLESQLRELRAKVAQLYSRWEELEQIRLPGDRVKREE
jgi:ABC transport system ATP-binding/permease protein